MTPREHAFSEYGQLAFESTGICSTCTECQKIYDMSAAELEECAGDIPGESFSWHPCERCGCSLGGTRYVSHGIVDGELEHAEVCVECLYAINGLEA